MFSKPPNYEFSGIEATEAKGRGSFAAKTLVLNFVECNRNMKIFITIEKTSLF